MNEKQLKEFNDLEFETSKEFAKIILNVTRFISDKDFEELMNEYYEDEMVSVYYDCNFSEVAKMYDLESDNQKELINQMFGYYGYGSLCISENGSGLSIIGC